MNEKIVTSESLMLDWYKKVMSSFCKPDDDIINSNFVSIDDSWLPSEKIIPLNLATFLSENFGGLLMCLIYDYKGIRQVCIDALDLEFKLNDMTKIERKQIRKNMRNGVLQDKHFMEIGVTSFSYSTMSKLLVACDSSIRKFDKSKFAKNVDKTIKDMDIKDKVLLSFVLSNFSYLIRAFCNNGEFYNNVYSIINDANVSAF